MNSYIKQWLEIIENMNNDNTYKLAWGRAIIELCFETNQLDKQLIYMNLFNVLMFLFGLIKLRLF